MESRILERSASQQVKAKRTVVDSQPFLEILVPFKPEIAAIQAKELGQLLILIVGYSSVDLEATHYYVALNEALRHWSVRGA